MARSWPSLGLFGVFGRSGDLRALDEALRAAGDAPRTRPRGRQDRRSWTALRPLEGWRSRRIRIPRTACARRSRS